MKKKVLIAFLILVSVFSLYAFEAPEESDGTVALYVYKNFGKKAGSSDRFTMGASNSLYFKAFKEKLVPVAKFGVGIDTSFDSALPFGLSFDFSGGISYMLKEDHSIKLDATAGFNFSGNMIIKTVAGKLNDRSFSITPYIDLCAKFALQNFGINAGIRTGLSFGNIKGFVLCPYIAVSTDLLSLYEYIR